MPKKIPAPKKVSAKLTKVRERQYWATVIAMANGMLRDAGVR